MMGHPITNNGTILRQYTIDEVKKLPRRHLATLLDDSSPGQAVRGLATLLDPPKESFSVLALSFVIVASVVEIFPPPKIPSVFLPCLLSLWHLTSCSIEQEVDYPSVFLPLSFVIVAYPNFVPNLEQSTFSVLIPSLGIVL